mmetsp:Transcript_28022/g.73372  ORF Transcript_28022/g.73372 Transcript_28022/m.73372 type:complete len:382 (+) Transcript_28022:3-1148(+)
MPDRRRRRRRRDERRKRHPSAGARGVQRARAARSPPPPPGGGQRVPGGLQPHCQAQRVVLAPRPRVLEVAPYRRVRPQQVLLAPHAEVARRGVAVDVPGAQAVHGVRREEGARQPPGARLVRDLRRRRLVRPSEEGHDVEKQQRVHQHVNQERYRGLPEEFCVGKLLGVLQVALQPLPVALEPPAPPVLPRAVQRRQPRRLGWARARLEDERSEDQAARDGEHPLYPPVHLHRGEVTTRRRPEDAPVVVTINEHVTAHQPQKQREGVATGKKEYQNRKHNVEVYVGVPRQVKRDGREEGLCGGVSDLPVAPYNVLHQLEGHVDGDQGLDQEGQEEGGRPRKHVDLSSELLLHRVGLDPLHERGELRKGRPVVGPDLPSHKP